MKLINTINEEIEKVFEEYNYHVTSSSQPIAIDPKPHHSDSIAMMAGRGTGHFGSGTYFSTYNCREKRDLDDHSKSNSELILIKNGVYRVDFDLYQNLYRVKTDQQGDYLFSCLKLSNNLFYSVFHNESNRKISTDYLKLLNNFAHIGLKLPKYKEFLTMFNSAGDDYKKTQSWSDQKGTPLSYATFATRLMEYNGFNGVNVSGIPKYDNTLHGSVIYDLSKLSSQPKEINISNGYCSDMKNDVIGVRYDDLKVKVLRNEDISTYMKQFSTLPENEQLTLMKRYKHYISSLWMNDMSNFTKNIYFKWLPYKIKNGIITDIPEKYDIEAIVDYNVNILYDKDIIINGMTMLDFVLDGILYQLSDAKEELVIKSINRQLNTSEKESYDYFIAEWGKYLNLK